MPRNMNVPAALDLRQIQRKTAVVFPDITKPIAEPESTLSVLIRGTRIVQFSRVWTAGAQVRNVDDG
jgi:hypothetical protein